VLYHRAQVAGPRHEGPPPPPKPFGLIDWGSGSWLLANPWKRFTTNGVSFNGPSITSASFTFKTAHRLASVQAYNGGSTPSVLTFSCFGQPQKQATLTLTRSRRSIPGGRGPASG
jgi:hypothetical protein